MQKIVRHHAALIISNCQTHFNLEADCNGDFKRIIESRLEAFKSEIIRHIANHAVLDEAILDASCGSSIRKN